jgi:hypothetical protein
MEVGRATESLIEGCATCHGGPGAVTPQVVERARAGLKREEQTRAALEKARLTIQVVRDVGADPAEAQALLQRAEDLFRRTGAWWHSFHLTPYETELIAIQGMAERAEKLALQPLSAP